MCPACLPSSPQIQHSLRGYGWLSPFSQLPSPAHRPVTSVTLNHVFIVPGMCSTSRHSRTTREQEGYLVLSETTYLADVELLVLSSKLHKPLPNTHHSPALLERGLSYTLRLEFSVSGCLNLKERTQGQRDRTYAESNFVLGPFHREVDLL